MAMTKAEKAEMENLRAARDMARALSWPGYAMPFIMTQEEIDAAPKVTMKGGGYPGERQVSVGWFMNPHSRQVSKGWSSESTHCTSMHPSGSQGSGKMYPTRLAALRAMRIELTEMVAKQLAAIDALIAAEGDTP